MKFEIVISLWDDSGWFVGRRQIQFNHEEVWEVTCENINKMMTDLEESAVKKKLIDDDIPF